MDATLRATLADDLFRYRGSLSRGARRSAFWRDPGFRFTWYLRHTAFFAARKRSWRLPLYLYYRGWLQHYRFRYGFDISPTMHLGSGFYLGHFGGVVISPYALIGRNVNIGKGVVIGAASRGKRKGAPTLEDRVWIGSNAVVVGKVTIGRGALIAPGAYVNFDVAENEVVLGNPGQVVSQSGSEGYIHHVREDAEESSRSLEPSA